MDKVFLDTNIIIDYANGKDSILKKLLELQKQQSAELYVDAVVIAEFFSDKMINTPNELVLARELFSNFSVIDITAKQGYEAGKLLRIGKAVSLGDALIASSCIFNSLKLATRNIKHFKKIPTLSLYTVS